jgi:hypothetical protein
VRVAEVGGGARWRRGSAASPSDGLMPATVTTAQVSKLEFRDSVAVSSDDISDHKSFVEGGWGGGGGLATG